MRGLEEGRMRMRREIGEQVWLAIAICAILGMLAAFGSGCSSGSSGGLPAGNTYGWNPGTTAYQPQGNIEIPWLGPIATFANSLGWGPEFCPPSGVTSWGGSCTPGAEYSNGSYRKHLYELAEKDGIHLEMVGTLDAGPEDMPQRATDSHSGAVVGCYNPDMGDPYGGSRFELCSIVDEVMTSYHPSLVLWGPVCTNEVLHGTSSDVDTRSAEAITHILETDDKVLVAVMLDPPVTGADEPGMQICRASLLATFTGMSSRVAIIDMAVGLDPTDPVAGTFDGVHWLYPGSVKMAENIWPFLKPLVVK